MSIIVREKDFNVDVNTTLVLTLILKSFFYWRSTTIICRNAYRVQKSGKCNILDAVACNYRVGDDCGKMALKQKLIIHENCLD